MGSEKPNKVSSESEDLTQPEEKSVEEMLSTKEFPEFLVKVCGIENNSEADQKIEDLEEQQIREKFDVFVKKQELQRGIVTFLTNHFQEKLGVKLTEGVFSRVKEQIMARAEENPNSVLDVAKIVADFERNKTEIAESEKQIEELREELERSGMNPQDLILKQREMKSKKDQLLAAKSFAERLGEKKPEPEEKFDSEGVKTSAQRYYFEHFMSGDDKVKTFFDSLSRSQKEMIFNSLNNIENIDGLNESKVKELEKKLVLRPEDLEGFKALVREINASAPAFAFMKYAVDRDLEKTLYFWESSKNPYVEKFFYGLAEGEKNLVVLFLSNFTETEGAGLYSLYNMLATITRGTRLEEIDTIIRFFNKNRKKIEEEYSKEKQEKKDAEIKEQKRNQAEKRHFDVVESQFRSKMSILSRIPVLKGLARGSFIEGELKSVQTQIDSLTEKSATLEKAEKALAGSKGAHKNAMEALVELFPSIQNIRNQAKDLVAGRIVARMNNLKKEISNNRDVSSSVKQMMDDQKRLDDLNVEDGTIMEGDEGEENLTQSVKRELAGAIKTVTTEVLDKSLVKAVNFKQLLDVFRSLKKKTDVGPLNKDIANEAIKDILKERAKQEKTVVKKLLLNQALRKWDTL